MKTCDEMVNSLLERRELHVSKQKRKKKHLIQAIFACCVCLIALLSFSIWKNYNFNTTPPSQEAEVSSKNMPNKSKIESAEKTVSSNISIGNYPHNYIPNGNELTMISSFDIVDSGSYATPENNEFYFSVPLKAAMNEYGDSVLYRVFIDVFRNKEQLAPNSSEVADEIKRLSDNGYIVAYETFFDGTTYHYYFTVHAKFNELKNFISNENYGYFMFLYDERVITN